MQIWQRTSYRRILISILATTKNENKTRIHISAHSLDGCDKNLQLIVWKVTIKASMRNKSIPETLALIKPKKKFVWFVSHLSHRIFFNTDYVIVEYMNQNTNYLWAQLNETVNAFCSWQTNLETVNYDFYANKYSIYSENETNIDSFQCAFFSNKCVQRMIYFYWWCYWRVSAQWSRIFIFIAFQNEQFTKLILGN